MAQNLPSESTDSTIGGTSESSAQTQLDPCNVFVKYLPSELTDAELTALFSSFGHVTSSKIMIDPTSKKSLGFGFVRFDTPTEARDAINGMNGHRMGTKRLLCKLANHAREKSHTPAKSTNGLGEPVPTIGRGPKSPGKATADQPGAAQRSPTSEPRSSPSLPSFAHINKFNTSDFSTSPTLSSPKPYATTPRAASSPIFSSIPQPPLVKAPTAPYRQPSTNLYIKLLLPSDTEDTLQELFGPFGNIVECKVMIDKTTGMSRQIGFVRFETLEQATVAIGAMNGIKRGDSTLRVKYADDERMKEIRRRWRQTTAQAGSASSLRSTAHIHPRSSASVPMITRHGTDTRPDVLHRGPASSPAFFTVQWPYAWSGAMYQPIYDPSSNSQWLILYPTSNTAASFPSSDGYTIHGTPTPGSPPAAPYHYPIYFPVDPAVSDIQSRPETTATVPIFPPPLHLSSIVPPLPHLDHSPSSPLSPSSSSPTSVTSSTPLNPTTPTLDDVQSQNSQMASSSSPSTPHS